MPVNKNYDLRRKVLNEAFRSRFFALDELILRVSDKLGESVSKKTVQDTIKYMRAEGAPIINEPEEEVFEQGVVKKQCLRFHK